MNPDALHALSTAACIGSEFRLSLLAEGLGLTPSETALRLRDAIKKDAVAPLDPAYRLLEAGVISVDVRYRFTHDRVQEAALKAMAQDTKLTTHLAIGRLLQRRDDRDAEIFAAVSHLFAAISLLSPPEELALASLCCEAGHRALAGAAYQPAYDFFEMGLKVLGSAAWQRDYDLTRTLHSSCVETGHAANHIGGIEQHFNQLLAECKDPIVTFAATRAVIDSLSQRSLHGEAIDLAISSLGKLGIRINRQAKKLDAVLAILKTKSMLPLKRLPRLLELPETKDKKALARMALIDEPLPSAFFQDPNLFCVMALKNLQLMLRNGISEDGVIALGLFGMIHASALKDFDGAHAAVQAAIKLGESKGYRRGTLRATAIYLVFIRGWKEHPRPDGGQLEELAQACVSIGDLEFACLVLSGCATTRVLTWEHLSNLIEGARGWSKMARRSNQVAAGRIVACVAQFAANLTGAAADPRELNGEFMQQHELTVEAKAARDLTGLACVLNFRAILLTVLGDYAGASKVFAEGMLYREAFAGLAPIYPQCLLFRAIAVLAAVKPGTKEARRIIRREVINNAFIKKIARINPESFAWGYALLRAEIARLRRQTDKALRTYQTALTLAEATHHLSAQALTLERIGRFALEAGLTAFGSQALRDAQGSYAKWGAMVKANMLGDELAALAEIAATGNIRIPSLPSTSGAAAARRNAATPAQIASTLDLESILKSLQLISGQLELNVLARDLMQLILETAGADRGFLILADEGGLHSYASGSVTKSVDLTVEKRPLDALGDTLPLAVIHYVSRAVEAIVLGDVQVAGSFESDPYLQGPAAPRSLACLPIAQQGELMGLLYVENSHIAGAFSAERMHILSLLAGQTAISLRNVYFVSEVKKRAKLESELDAAKTVQGALLPAASIVPGFELVTYYHPMDQTGGDWYDYHYDARSERLFLQIGDVVGHGIPCALVTGAVCGAMASYHYIAEQLGALPLHEALGVWVGAANHAVRATGARVGRDMTMFFVAIDTASGQGAFANAGHRPGIFVRGREAKPLLASGNPLGGDDSQPWPSRSFEIKPGDRLFLYTDGLIESPNPGQQSRQMQRRLPVILTQDDSLLGTKAAILEAWQELLAGEEPNDDCTFLLIEARAK